ncbi:MAG: acyltransferase domain-containing protein [Deltaproteobacteria bacterium]|nr:acyltransferase domain-containing protein [Deltaproteobacteria bacterium]
MSRYDIAVVGMGCIVPNANNLQQYWENIVSGDMYFKDMPESLWRLKNFYSKDRTIPGKSYTIAGSFVENFEFPALKFKMPPANLRGIDPAQLMTVVATEEALQDAGIPFRDESLTEGITIIGASGVDGFAHSAAFLKRHTFLRYMKPVLEKHGVDESTYQKLYEQMTAELDARGHIWNPSVAAVGAIPSSLSNRVAQIFGLRGMNMTVDGACASSFVAIEAACHALMAGDANIAVAGGTDLGTNPPIYVGFSAVNGLSERGVANPFDHSADGLVIGEGVAIVVLKRLEDALRNGDRIRAVIRGIGSSSDGAGQAIYNPSVEGRARAFQAALQISETDANEVQFIEAHATSTVVGDANEYDAISTVYGNRSNTVPIKLGSVKQQIGHLKAAAGVAGMLKTVLAMENGLYPHMPRFEKLTPLANKVTDRLEIPTKISKWVPNADGLRVAAVTTSGFGGVNYHMILEQGDAYKMPAPRVVPDRRMAIVGVSLRTAGADTVEQFWDNISSGRDTFSRVTDPEKFGWENHFDKGPENEKINTYVVSELEEYDANLLKHKIFPKAVSQISPTQLLALDTSDRLLKQYGFSYKEPKNIGVSLGSMHDDYYPTIFYPMLNDEYCDAVNCTEVSKEIGREIIDEACQVASQKICDKYPPVTEHTLPGWMTNITAGRVANKLNCHGPNFTVDSACSSGMAALVPAMYHLMFGNVDMMIAGGLNRQLSDTFTSGVCALGAVAKEVTRPFDEEGKGYLIGEGSVLFLLKRYADAKKDGDDIFGVIHAVGGSSEADSRSMVAPTQASLERAIRNAMRQTDIQPESVGVSETHGSANKLSDIVEAGALAACLRPNGATGMPVKITAIKSHVGHLYGGSAPASVLSTVLSLRNRLVPGIRNLNTVRKEIAPLADLVAPAKQTEALSDACIAGAVSTLGLGGANYFSLLTGGDMDAQSKNTTNISRGAAFANRPMTRATDQDVDDIFICLVESKDDFKRAIGRALQQETIPNVISEGAEVNERMTVTFDSPSALRNKLKNVLKMLDGGYGLTPLESQGVFVSRTKENGSRLAFCLPGQGVHYISMGKFLYDSEPIFKEVVDAVHQASMDEFDFDLLGHIYGDEEDVQIKKNLGTLVGAQTSLYAIEVALAKLLISRGIVPDVMIGHSFGEISALTISGAWTVTDGYKAVIGRIKAAEIVRDAGGPPLGMASVVCSDDQIAALLKVGGDNVLLTNVNAPGRFILGGVKEDVKRCVDLAESFGVDAQLLPIGSAFHCRYMEPAREPFKKWLKKIPCGKPTIPILSTVTGDYIDLENCTADYLASHLSSQLVTKLDLPREINRLYSEGVKHYLEIGPRWAMTKMIDAILAGRPYRAVPTLHPKVGDVETYRRARAFLTATGHMMSAAERSDVPGMFSPDFLEYMQKNEPSVLALIEEVYTRYHHSIGAVRTSPVSTVAVASPRTAALTVLSPATAPATAVTAPQSPASVPAAIAETNVAAQLSAPVSAAGTVNDWKSRLREKLVVTTGYPADMLEDDLDLEADLGVDSVQRAEIWVALTTEYGLSQDVRPEGARTISNLAKTLAKMDADKNGAVSVESAPAPTAPAVAPAVAEAAIASGSVDDWKRRLREKLVVTTGYPADMLEDDLDLEADLGVDSVQRAEIWVSLVSEHGLSQDVRPEGARTISNLAQTLAQMDLDKNGAPVASAVGAPAPAPAEPTPVASAAVAVPEGTAGAGDVDAWKSRLREKLVVTTGYPADMLEDDLDLEADLGVDSVQRAEIWVSLVTEHGLNQDVRPEGARTISNLAKTLAKMDADKNGSATETPSVETVAVETSESLAAEVPAVASGAVEDVDTWKSRLREKLVVTTGYPAEMLEDDLDLEADLGVDSVQRAEIWVSLVTEYGLNQDVRPEGARTISNLAKTLAKMDADKGGSAGKKSEAEVPKAGASAKSDDEIVTAYELPEVAAFDDANACHLYAAGTQYLDNTQMTPFDCKQVLAITGADNGALLGRLKRRLTRRNIELSSVKDTALCDMDVAAVTELIDGADTIVYLAHETISQLGWAGEALQAAVDEQVTNLYQVFRLLIPILTQTPKRLIFPVTMDGRFGVKGTSENILGAFPCGFVRCLYKELPSCTCQLIDAGAMDWADSIDANIDVVAPYLELGMVDGGRVTPVMAQVAPSPSRVMELEKDDVVLVTGGARGIVFECVFALARYTGCKLILTGRTELPEGNQTWLDAAPESIDNVIRQMEINMVKNEGMKLPDAKRIGAKTRSQWEVVRNLKQLEKAGVEAVYEKCDVSSREELAALIQRVSDKETIAGIVHGSGVQKSAMILDLPQRNIDLTLKTKLTPMFTMIDEVDWSSVKLVAGFGSIAGLFGNSGQSDYALGNDMLAWLIKELVAEHPHIHAQTVEWTAWTGTGMVSEQEGKRFKDAGLIALTVETGVPLFMEGITGVADARVSAFNATADFSAGRPFLEFPLAARPRMRLLADKDSSGNQLVHFSLQTDTYINQHLVNLEPVIPGTFVTEIFAESLHGTGLIPADIHFRRPMQLRGDELTVEVIRTEDDQMMIVPKDRPDLNAKALTNLSYASCHLVKSAPVEGAKLKITKKDLKQLQQLSLETSASFYGMLDEKFYRALKTGPVFRGVRATIEDGDMFYSTVTLTTQALAALEQPGNFVFNPVLADMAVQVAAAWAMIRHNAMEIPFEIGTLHVAGAIHSTDAVVICREIEITKEKSTMDVAVRNLDGSLIMTLNGLVLKTIMTGE